VPSLVSESGEWSALAPGQLAMWLIAESGTPHAAYAIPAIFELNGALDRCALRAAFAAVLDRHEALRTGIEDRGGMPMQRPVGDAVLDWREVTLPSAADSRPVVEQFITEPFDLRHGRLLRVLLAELAPDHHLLAVVIHHIACDGVSLQVLFRDLATAYNTALAGAPRALPALPAQYRHFAAWSTKRLESGDLDASRQYWTGKLRGTPSIELPSDRPRPLVRTLDGDVATRVLRDDVAARFRALCRKGRSTPFTGVYALLHTALSRYTGERDFAIGTSTVGRTRPEWADQIGYHVNTLALRDEFLPGTTFREAIRQAQSTILDGLQHQEYPFHELVREIAAGAPQNRNPIFDVMFELDGGWGDADVPFSGLAVVRRDTPCLKSKMDLSLFCAPTAGGLRLDAEYSTELFDASWVNRLLAHLETIMGSACEAPDAPIDTLEMLPEAERRILVGFNDTAHPYDLDRTLHSMFAEQAARTPDRIATVDDERAVTFADLDAESDAIATLLRRDFGASRGSLVALHLPRSVHMTAAILGVLKSGAAYLPLSIKDPQERLCRVLADASVTVVLTATAAEAGRYGAGVTAVDVTDVAAHGPQEPVTADAGPDDPAYCIYTSGSTGNPNGVIIHHRAIVNRLVWMIDELGLTADDVFLQKTPCTFDVSVWELLLPVILGARQVMLAPGAHGDPQALVRAIRRHAVTIVHFVPSMLDSYLSATTGGFNGVRHCVCSGEILGLDLVCRFFAATGAAGTRLHNYYGPTEAAVDVTSAELTPGASQVTIGRPAPNNHAYVLTGTGGLTPIGVPGQLHLGGVQVARGYLNRPELTAQRFGPNPFHPGVMYRTGDLAAWREDGTLAYLGRGDRQVKLRGMRIELEEVEGAIQQIPGVTRAVVTLQDNGAGSAALCAYVAGANPPAPESLRRELAQRLPPYMVPAYYVAVDALPVTANGKLDRRALVPLSQALIARQDPVAPRNPVEAALLQLWHQALPAPRLGVTDDFFAVGGESLSALRLATRINERFGTGLNIADLMTHRTVEAQAALVEHVTPPAPEPVPAKLAGDQLRYPLSHAQERMWYLHLLEPDSGAYSICLLARLDGPVDAAALQRAIDIVVARHEMLRVSFGDVDGQPYQQLHGGWRVELAVENLTRLGADAAADALDAQVKALADRPFDLRSEPPFRAVLFRLTPSESRLFLSLHHIAADGWSVRIISRDLTAAYAGVVRAEPPDLPVPATRYLDYARTARDAAANDTDGGLAYWVPRLTGTARLALPTDTQHAGVTASASAGRTSLRIDGGTYTALRSFALAHRVTVFDVMMATLAAHLALLTGQEDIAIGFPIANRTSLAQEDVVGLFLNTLVLRTPVAGTMTFLELLQLVSAGLHEAYEHQSVPFEVLVDRVNPERRWDRSPFFDVMLNFVGDIHDEFPDFGDIAASFADDGLPVQAKLPLTLYVETQGDTLILDLVHRRDLFSAERAVTLLGQFAHLLTEVPDGADRPVGSLSLLTRQARARLELALGTPIDAPQLPSVPALVAAAAHRHSAATAVQHGDNRLTYAELVRRATEVSRLVDARAAEGDVVCVHGQRGIGFVVALLGVLGSRAVVFPLDAALPEARRAQLVMAARPAVVLDVTGPGLAEPVWDGIETVAVDADTGALPTVALSGGYRAGRAPEHRSPAYLFFTSGTTGTPRGVLGWHGALSHFLLWQAGAFGISDADTCAQTTNASFDVMLRDTLLGLVAGGRVLIPPAGDRALTGRALLRWMRDEGVTVLHAVPSIARNWIMDDELPDCLPALRFAFFAGEPLKSAFVDGFRAVVGPGPEVVNLYGPTETTLAKCFYRLGPGPLPAVVPVGRPMPQCEVYVLRGATPCGVAEPGEIVIRTPMRTLGYYRDPDATRQAFRDNPHLPADRGGLYYTGDIGRFDEHGLIEVLGRRDDQLKVNGVRIQPAEVENAVLNHPDVDSCIVAGVENGPLGTVLVAYAVTRIPPESLVRMMREYLSPLLPTPMIPTRWVSVASIPLTPNGKPDRRALAAQPPRPAARAPVARRARTPIEEALLAMWQDVIGRQHIGIDKDFFAIGGNSLALLRLFAHLDRRFPGQIRIAQLFSHTTIAAQAVLLDPAASVAPAPVRYNF
jgi:amino acid adenylation domain-containing protein